MRSTGIALVGFLVHEGNAPSCRSTYDIADNLDAAARTQLDCFGVFLDRTRGSEPAELPAATWASGRICLGRGPMPPDFLLRCTGCGGEAIWDTEATPPVGVPEIGHPVLWRCETCGGEQRHIVEQLCIIGQKLHHDICLATEIDRPTVERVMTELCRYRKDTRAASLDRDNRASEEIEDVAGATGVPRELVLDIAAAETEWMRRRGYTPAQHRADS